MKNEELVKLIDEALEILDKVAYSLPTDPHLDEAYYDILMAKSAARDAAARLEVKGGV